MALTDNLFNPNQVTPQENPASNPDLMYAMQEVFSSKNIDMKTDVNQRQINALTKGQLYAKEFKSKLMSELVVKMMRLLISKNRKGRSEFIQMTQQLQSQQAPQEGIAKRLLGI